MTGLWIWLGAVVAYLGFRAWYDNWRGPLRPEEIETFSKRLEASSLSHANDLDTIRSFMERDDGREFMMLNLVRLAPEPVPHPETGEPTLARALLDRYIRFFLPQLLRRAGHPLLQARKVGGYVDAWGVEPDPGWSFIGYMRYRSRRDMLELATDEHFKAAHPFKFAALAATFSFPTQPGLSLYAGPRIWVALVLALAAAIAHLAATLLA